MIRASEKFNSKLARIFNKIEKEVEILINLNVQAIIYLKN